MIKDEVLKELRPDWGTHDCSDVPHCPCGQEWKEEEIIKKAIDLTLAKVSKEIERRLDDCVKELVNIRALKRKASEEGKTINKRTKIAKLDGGAKHLNDLLTFLKTEEIK